jgi:NADH dehydrogenase
MFGPDDGFLTTLAKLVRLPAIPLFGRGDTRLQPADVEDVGEAIARLLLQAQQPARFHEFGGPHVYRYRDLLRSIAGASGRNPVLVPVPFAFWHLLAFMSEPFPFPPLTRNQVELMQTDNVAGTDPGFGELGISPRAIEDVLREIV